MRVTGATNSGLYPATGLSDHLAASGQFPTLMARRLGGRAPYGLIILAVAVIIVVVVFDLSAVASIGSAVALSIFGIVTLGHEPASIVTLVAILGLSILLDVGWSRRRVRVTGTGDGNAVADVPRPIEGGPA